MNTRKRKSTSSVVSSEKKQGVDQSDKKETDLFSNPNPGLVKNIINNISKDLALIINNNDSKYADKIQKDFQQIESLLKKIAGIKATNFETHQNHFVIMMVLISRYINSGQRIEITKLPQTLLVAFILTLKILEDVELTNKAFAKSFNGIINGVSKEEKDFLKEINNEEINFLTKINLFVSPDDVDYIFNKEQYLDRNYTPLDVLSLVSPEQDQIKDAKTIIPTRRPSYLQKLFEKLEEIEHAIKTIATLHAVAPASIRLQLKVDYLALTHAKCEFLLEITKNLPPQETLPMSVPTPIEIPQARAAENITPAKGVSLSSSRLFTAPSQEKTTDTTGSTATRTSGHVRAKT